jgi:hypothetical protein
MHSQKRQEPEHVGQILAGFLRQSAAGSREPLPTAEAVAEPSPQAAAASETIATEGRYDFDLAEFPLFHFYKNRDNTGDREPLTYADTITGRDDQRVTREWKVYPGPFGFGGQSTQVLLYDLLQLYVEQGSRGSQIQFGTLRSLFRRRGERNPSKHDYERLRRDLDILRGYDLHCKNAFWDRKRQAYVDMKWRLFGSVFYFRDATPEGEELPFGFIEVSPVLQQVARTRGFFSLGFESRLFYELKPLEQRLAVYLSKKFLSQKLHRRFVDDLAKALPIEAARDRDQRAMLKQTANALLAKKLPILDRFSLERSRDGRWVATFHRAGEQRTAYTLPAAAAEELTPAISSLVDRIVEATGNADDRLWWAQCAKRLGAGPVDRALGQLKEAKQLGRVTNPGGLLTKIFKDIAAEGRIALN